MKMFSRTTNQRPTKKQTHEDPSRIAWKYNIVWYICVDCCLQVGLVNKTNQYSETSIIVMYQDYHEIPNIP